MIVKFAVVVAFVEEDLVEFVLGGGRALHLFYHVGLAVDLLDVAKSFDRLTQGLPKVVHHRHQRRQQHLLLFDFRHRKQ